MILFVSVIITTSKIEFFFNFLDIWSLRSITNYIEIRWVINSVSCLNEYTCLKYKYAIISVFTKWYAKTICTTIQRYPIFSTKYSIMCKVYTGYHGTSEIEHGLCACTVDNPLAKARGLSLRTGAQTMLYLSLAKRLLNSVICFCFFFLFFFSVSFDLFLM